MHIGKKILNLRKGKGWTQSELAEKLYVSDKAVSKWEQGGGIPDIENIVNLSTVFDVSTDYLLKENKSEAVVQESNTKLRYYPIIIAHTHADFLNELLGKQYKQYMRCTYHLDRNNLIWMIRLNEEISSTGWKNTLVFADFITEEYLGREEDKLDSHKGLPINQRRYVFEIVEEHCEDAPQRYYEFRGVFELNLERSKESLRLWQRVETKVTIQGEEYEVIDQKETHQQHVESMRALDKSFESYNGLF